jgi:2',3'-cyclic-nucleotide 2'-phosphodiesterase (5'-nucleotidase family)
MNRITTLISAFIFSLLLSCSPKTAPLVATDTENRYLLGETAELDTQMAEFITPYRDSLTEKMNRLVTILPQKMTHSRNNPQTLIGPWVCDILLAEGKVLFPEESIDGAIYNPGGIRLPLLEDSITVGKIYELLPFDNKLSLLKLSGDELQNWIEHTVSRGGWPMSKSLNVYVSSDTISVLINNSPIQKGRKYEILTNDYVAGGGDNCDFLIGLSIRESRSFIRDIVISHFDKGNAPRIPKQVRIHFMRQN